MTFKEAAVRIEDHMMVHKLAEHPNAVKITEALVMAIKLLLWMNEQDLETQLPSIEKHMYDYSSAYVNGAASFMQYMYDLYNGEAIYPHEMKDILIEFLEQFGEVRDVQYEH